MPTVPTTGPLPTDDTFKPGPADFLHAVSIMEGLGRLEQSVIHGQGQKELRDIDKPETISYGGIRG
jgi:hypothetical protein